MRVASYIRVSTDEQVDKGNSLIEQRERQAAYCIAMGWDVPVFFIDDGYSAKNLNRPGIKRLIDSIEGNEFDIVLTSKLDRLCRNLLDLLQTIKLFDEHNCNYVSASEGFDTSTLVGRMTLQLLGSFAEFERGRISERVKDNMMSLARNTDKALTLPCYGYDLVDGRYQINEQEAQNVLFMFDLAEQCHGHRMIAKRLNEKGATTKRGKSWDQINVKRLIQTETISGVMVYNKRQTDNGKVSIRDKSEWIVKDDNHPAIIPPDRFQNVQDIFRSRSRAHKHAENESYLLTGLVKCKYCGGNMKGSTSRQKTKYNEYIYYRYICASYVLGYGCKHHAVHRDGLENEIIERIKELAIGSLNDIKEMKVALSHTIEDEKKELKVQLTKVDKQMQKQIEAYGKDLISDYDLKVASERVEAERLKLNGQLEKLETQSGDAQYVKRNAARLIGDITGVDRIKAKNSMRILIDRIIIEADSVSITWKV
jgi:site-specific DNA recombinase